MLVVLVCVGVGDGAGVGVVSRGFVCLKFRQLRSFYGVRGASRIQPRGLPCARQLRGPTSIRGPSSLILCIFLFWLGLRTHVF
jgi:hypothetical protein